MATELDHEHPHAQGHQGQRHQEASAGVLKLDPCHPPPNKIIFPAKQKKKAKKSLSAKHKPFEDLGCFSGCLMSSAGMQKLFCGIYSVFKCSFDEFVGDKVFSLSYSSAILAPPPSCTLFT